MDHYRMAILHGISPHPTFLFLFVFLLQKHCFLSVLLFFYKQSRAVLSRRRRPAPLYNTLLPKAANKHRLPLVLPSLSLIPHTPEGWNSNCLSGTCQEYKVDISESIHLLLSLCWFVDRRPTTTWLPLLLLYLRPLPLFCQPQSMAIDNKGLPFRTGEAFFSSSKFFWRIEFVTSSSFVAMNRSIKIQLLCNPPGDNPRKEDTVLAPASP
mmetsp:Transcript_37340/g.90742  ORF Transcript_37340/g.90742 Transcript_37340/m.90742 type:complete len:210 (-) Transcript_37340:1368-1997(-)